MALFLKQNERRSPLQSKLAADLDVRLNANKDTNKSKDTEPVMLNDSQEATGRSLFWVGVVTMVVIALVVFVLFIFEGF